MYANKLSVKMKLDKPVFIDENTIEIGFSINGCKICSSKSLLFKNDGQGWHPVKVENN
jgi:hypothetical protein